MLLQAVRLSERADAFTSEFTPFDLIEQILERDGEFTEWQDENTMSIGGFGLNYAAVGPVRESALDYLDYSLNRGGGSALQAVRIMEGCFTTSSIAWDELRQTTKGSGKIGNENVV
jgi:hypothetical protein